MILAGLVIGTGLIVLLPFGRRADSHLPNGYAVIRRILPAELRSPLAFSSIAPASPSGDFRRQSQFDGGHFSRSVCSCADQRDRKEGNHLVSGDWPTGLVGRFLLIDRRRSEVR